MLCVLIRIALSSRFLFIHTTNIFKINKISRIISSNICIYGKNSRYLSSVSARARFLRFDPVKSSADATEVSQCVFCDATKLPPLKCLKNPVNTQLSVKRAWDISLLKYIHRYYRLFTPDNAILSHLFLERSA